MRRLALLAFLLCLSTPSWAAGFACNPDECARRINAIVGKTSPHLVAAKEICVIEGGDERCRYKSRSGPGLNFISKPGSRTVRTILVVDVGGLTAKGAGYLLAIMEAFDSSLDDKGRTSLFNQLIGDFARVEAKGGTVEKSSRALKYVLVSADKVSMFGVTDAN